MSALFIDWFVLCLAPFTGGFLSVIITRVPDRRDWVMGRSACGSCDTQLTARDLIPLVSWMSTGGRCRHCRAPVSVLYPLLELATIFIAIVCVAFTDTIATVLACIAGNALLTIAIMEVRRLRAIRPMERAYLALGEATLEPFCAPGAYALWSLSKIH